MKLYLIRHGQTDWNVEGRVMGRQEIPLNKQGLEQSKKLATWFREKKIGKLYSSPVKRAFDTACFIEKTTKIKTIKDERITEVNFGQWDGKIYGDLKKEPGFKIYYDYFDANVIPGGEKYTDVEKRVIDFYNEQISGNACDVAMVSHADPIKIIVCRILSCPISSSSRINISNCSVTMINTVKGPSLDFLNFCPWA
jgi:broad specificity phosphatase PhoE